MTINQKELDVLLKNNCDLMDKVKTQEAHIKSLMIKLKGVRNARKRDNLKAKEQLDWYIEQMTELMKTVKSKKVDSYIKYLRFMITGIRDELIDSEKVTINNWFDAEANADKKWKESHK